MLRPARKASCRDGIHGDVRRDVARSVRNGQHVVTVAITGKGAEVVATGEALVTQMTVVDGKSETSREGGHYASPTAVALATELGSIAVISEWPPSVEPCQMRCLRFGTSRLRTLRINEDDGLASRYPLDHVAWNVVEKLVGGDEAGDLLEEAAKSKGRADRGS